MLIDDREATRLSWEEAGGVFLLHINVDDTIRQLRDLGLNIPEESYTINNNNVYDDSDN